LHIDEVAFAPETNLGNHIYKRIDAEIDGFAWDSAINLEVKIVEGDFSVRIDDSFCPETEDILG
jgi:hypothetical protein